MATIQYVLLFVGFGLWFLMGYRIGFKRAYKQIPHFKYTCSEYFYHPEYDLYYKFGVFKAIDYKKGIDCPAPYCTISQSNDDKTSEWNYCFEVTGDNFTKEVNYFKKHYNAKKHLYGINKDNPQTQKEEN